MGLLNDRIKPAWNVFTGKSSTDDRISYIHSGYGMRPDRSYSLFHNDRSVLNTIINKIAVDAASIDIRHVRLNEDYDFKEIINDSLNQIFSVSANIDQTGRDFVQDIVQSMLEEGCVAVVPVEADFSPLDTDSYKIYSARVGKIVEWMPRDVRVELYNEQTGRREEVVVDKRFTAIIQNPFYSIMNEPNSTLQRLLRVLNQLDDVNSQLSSGKMDLIVQLPFSLKTPAKQALAEGRRKDIEAQLTNSKYGIAYIDQTERIIQLNRPIENDFWVQAKELKADFFTQMGLTMEIINGTANEETMTNYYSRVVEPILTAVVEGVGRVWISKTARTQRQDLRYYRDAFKLVPVGELAEIADKMTRNEIMSSNEVRAKMGMKASDDPKANQLRNSNLNHEEDPNAPVSPEPFEEAIAEEESVKKIGRISV